MRQRIGIDAGGSLVKICYEQNNQLHYRKHHYHEMEDVLKWLNLVTPNANYKLTGGKAGILQEKYFANVSVVPEFQATCEGAIFLTKAASLSLERYLLVNVGTGTSWYIINGDQHKRIFGSGVGGGTFLGLGSILAGETAFSSFVDLSNSGNREKVDLLVKDIYGPNKPPINGDLTASNFAKGRTDQSHKSDDLASLTNMISETIVLLTSQLAINNEVDIVIFIGSTVSGHPKLKESLHFYTNMLGLKSFNLDHGEYSGAVGALLTI
ncbi:type II pantothenate kinase [Cytobacillus sp. FJAT-54145]|uniref:Type II pantothenate kinase n=1 Tax=Cytobacillus spartinae TaxID=3299023 RepID=A0ABW6K4Y8_9BACI